MKYIKTFIALNESHQDGLDIIDALKNSPEGKDLVKIASSGDPNFNFDTAFEFKKTGRIWCIGMGAKTFIERRGNEYGFESISQGKYYGAEFYPTIKECLRALWTNLLGKKSIGLGIKKDEFRKWIDANITPGQELSMNDISAEYLKSKGQAIPDLANLPNTPFFKMINGFFKVNYYNHLDSQRYYYLDIDVTNPFGVNICDLNQPPSTNYTLNARIDIEAKVTGKSRLASSGSGGIILCDPNNLEKDFRDLFIKWFTQMLSGEINNYRLVNLDFLIKRTGHNPNGACAYLYQILYIILEVFKEEITDTDIEYSLENIIDELRIKSPVAFAKIIRGMEKSGIYPELTKKYNDKYSAGIKGAAMLDRFGLRGKKKDI
jgi:hypothetical protein